MAKKAIAKSPMTWTEKLTKRWCEQYLWFLPDHWRHQENYDAIGSKTPDGWAWEFLRRNPEYRSGFLDRCKVKRKATSSQMVYFSSEFWPGPIVHSDDEPPMQLHDGESYGFPSSLAIPRYGRQRRLSGSMREVENSQCADMWRLRCDYLNPNILSFAANFWKPFGFSDDVHPRDRFGDTKKSFIVDIEVSWERQKEDLMSFRGIKGILSKRKGRKFDRFGNRNVRLRPAVFREQLRLLDARASGASYEEIAKVLFPNPGPNEDSVGKVDRRLQKARKRQEEYLEILGAAVDKRGYVRENKKDLE